MAVVLVLSATACGKKSVGDAEQSVPPTPEEVLGMPEQNASQAQAAVDEALRITHAAALGFDPAKGGRLQDYPGTEEFCDRLARIRVDAFQAKAGGMPLGRTQYLAVEAAHASDQVFRAAVAETVADVYDATPESALAAYRLASEPCERDQ